MRIVRKAQGIHIEMASRPPFLSRQPAATTFRSTQMRLPHRELGLIDPATK
jgi:hypothetical protein